MYSRNKCRKFLPISQAKGQGGIRRSTDVEHTKGDYLIMDMFVKLVNSANTFLWNVVLILLLCGTGIYYTFRLKFVQIREFKQGLKQVFGGIGKKHEKKEGEMTSFQSVATAIAAQVGTGNLTGAATALIGGGPGAIFWMWMSAFFGMATIYAEATLAQNYKTVKHGEVTVMSLT